MRPGCASEFSRESALVLSGEQRRHRLLTHVIEMLAKRIDSIEERLQDADTQQAQRQDEDLHRARVEIDGQLHAADDTLRRELREVLAGSSGKRSLGAILLFVGILASVAGNVVGLFA